MSYTYVVLFQSQSALNTSQQSYTTIQDTTCSSGATTTHSCALTHQEKFGVGVLPKDTLTGRLQGPGIELLTFQLPGGLYRMSHSCRRCDFPCLSYFFLVMVMVMLVFNDVYCTRCYSLTQNWIRLYHLYNKLRLSSWHISDRINKIMCLSSSNEVS